MNNSSFAPRPANTQLAVPELTDSVKTLVWMTDADGVLTYLSHSVSHLLEPGAVLSISVYVRLIHAEDQARVAEMFRQAHAKRDEFHTDYRIIAPDGTLHWISASGAPRHSDAGEFCGYTGVLIDVTERYAALARLTESEATHRFLIENSSDLISHHAPGTGTHLYASPSFKQVLGFEPSELVGTQRTYDYVHPDDMHVLQAEVARQLETGICGKAIEFRAQHKDGHYLWMATGLTVLRNPLTGEKIGTVAVTRDITTEREAKDELKKREEQFRSLTTLSSDWYWETDEHGRLSYLRPGIDAVAGLAPDDIIGKTRHELASHPDEPGLLAYSQTMARREPFRNLRYAAKGAKSGTLHYASISGEPYVDDGVFKGYRGIGRDITQQVETAGKLAQLADENRSLVENSLDIIALMDPLGRILRVNAAVFELLGYRPDELLGKRYVELLHPDEMSTMQAVDTGLRIGQNTSQDQENRWMCKDGSVVYLSWSVRWSEHQQLMYATARDVTERYRAQHELRKSKDELNAMLNSIGDAFFALSSEWRITYANEKAAAFVGKTVAQGVGMLLLDVAPELSESPTLLFYQRAMETREKLFFETYWEPSGAWVEVRIYPNDDGISVYFHDITDKREAQDAIRKSEQRFKSVFEHAGDIIIITDNALRICNANERACQALGYSKHELLQLSVRDIVNKFDQRIPLLDSLRAGLTRLLAVVKKRKDGSTFPAEVHLSRFEDDGEEYFQAIVRDLTERTEAERKIRDSELRLREVIEMTPAGYVLSDGAGEILDVNAALSSICGYSKGELIGQSLAKLFTFCPWEGVAFVRGGPIATHGMEAVIKHKNGQDVHVLFNGSVKRDSNGDAVCMTGLMTDITARKQAESRLELLATHDTLTGLPNRALLNDRVQQMLSVGSQGMTIAVMFIDLDRFKDVNDSFGHEPGDMLLCEVARRLQKALRPSDVIARLGGDEFVVAAYCSGGKTSAVSIAEKLLAMLAVPIAIGAHEVIIGASIGISMFPHDAQTKDLLFQSADTAMYRAKAAGRNGYCFFEAEMTVTTKARMALELSLRPALARKEFELHYQPRIDLKTMSVVGMEALVRWNHPELGLVSPMQFVPIAEDTGLIDPIGQWVLEEACTQTRRLMYKVGRPLRVSVNVSARQLRCDRFVDKVQAVLSKTNFPPQLLELELTESALIEDIERTAGMLKQLKKLGIKLAVDDFGTGYSGLAYLRRFPIDVLKLDRSFVLQEDEGISSFNFIKAFVDMAHALKLSVVAEGVETEEVLAFLRSTYCDEAQGYFLAKPLTMAAFERYLAG